MATRRDTARAQDHADPTTVSDTELLPGLREYHTSDLQPPTSQAYARAMFSLVEDVNEIADSQTPPGRVLQ